CTAALPPGPVWMYSSRPLTGSKPRDALQAGAELLVDRPAPGVGRVGNIAAGAADTREISSCTYGAPASLVKLESSISDHRSWRAPIMSHLGATWEYISDIRRNKSQRGAIQHRR